MELPQENVKIKSSTIKTEKFGEDPVPKVKEIGLNMASPGIGKSKFTNRPSKFCVQGSVSETIEQLFPEELMERLKKCILENISKQPVFNIKEERKYGNIYYTVCLEIIPPQDYDDSIYFDI
jgi:hypothetical protein